MHRYAGRATAPRGWGNVSGWIKLHRRIVDSDIYMMPPLYLRVFERLLLEANHQDNEIPYKERGAKVTGKKLIKRGERLTSVRDICKWVAWYERGRLKVPNPKTIQEILDWLVLNGMLEIYGEKGNRTETHYKVVNYGLYQSEDEAKVTEQKQLGNSQVTEKQQSLETNKNVKNEENDKKRSVAPKLQFAEAVKLTEAEHQKLIEAHGEVDTARLIEILNNYKLASGKKYKSDYYAIRNWVVKRLAEEKGRSKPLHNYPQQEQGKSVYGDLDLYRLPTGEG